MDNFKDQIRETKENADALTATVSNLYKKLADLNQQQADMAKAGNTNNKYYETLIGLLDKYQGRLHTNIESLTNMNVKMYDQMRVLTSSREHVEIFGKAWDNTTASIEAGGKNTEYMGKILRDSANGFKTFTGNLKNAQEVITPFKDGITKANQVYTEYAQNVASGKGKFESFKGAISGLTKGVDEGAGGFKNFKIALAETGIGLIVIAVAALIEKLQTMKPVMEFINGITASIGAVMSTLGNSIVGLFTNPIETIKNFGSSMAGAAKDAYNLSIAQDKLKTALSSQEVANEKIKNQVDLLKQQADNTKLTTDVRRVKLQEAHTLDEKYFKENGDLANMAMDQAVRAAKIKGTLHNDEVANLRSKGTEYARILLETGRIDQEQFDAIKKADLELIKMRKEHGDSYKTFLEGNQKLSDEDSEKNEQRQQKNQQAHEKARQEQEKSKQLRQQELDEIKRFSESAAEATASSAMRMAHASLKGYELEITQTKQHFDEMLKQYLTYQTKYLAADKAYQKLHSKEYETVKKAITQLKAEEATVTAGITQKFRDDELIKLQAYNDEIDREARKAGKTARQLAEQDLEDQYKAKNKIVDDDLKASQGRRNKFNDDALKASGEKLVELKQKIDAETAILTKADEVKLNLETKYNNDKQKLSASFKNEDDNTELQNNIDGAQQNGDWEKEFELKTIQLNKERDFALAAVEGQEAAVAGVKFKYAQKQQQLDKAKLDAQAESQKKYLKTTESLSNAVMSIFGKNTIASRIAFKAHQAASAAQVIIDTKRSIMGIWAANGTIPFVGVPKAIAETAIVAAAGATSLASIIKQKPGFAQGGRYVSDGRGAVLQGYSRTDNTNAYLRSGEAVVVSEAMRNPWARNLVSAINVAHGGRDFSMPNTGRGYAIGGIFTDGGNANRYYNQPVNDIKDMANTLAYQMINNFPPIYVDVKDVNNQQNILAQTIDRVNL